MRPAPELFFHSTHRVGRTGFLLGISVLIAFSMLGQWHWAFYIPVIYSAVCVLSLRLHDRGRSGWWSWLLVLAYSQTLTLFPGKPLTALNGVALATLAVAAVDLVILPGQKQFNRYGRPPGQTA